MFMEEKNTTKVKFNKSSFFEINGFYFLEYLDVPEMPQTL